MRMIVAGGRDYYLNYEDYNKISSVWINHACTEFVSGHCPTGADKCGEEWAKVNGIIPKLFPADWESYGNSAGPIRNRHMAKYADILVLFKGDKGSANMFNAAKKQGLIIYDFRY